MTTSTDSEIRVMGIDVSSVGFGYAFLEGEDRLLEWGVSRSRGNKNREALRKIDELVTWYQPSVLVVEDIPAGHSQRDRAIALVAELERWSRAHKLEFARVRWSKVQKACGGSLDATKDVIARAVASRFPELADRLPPPRQLWMPEDCRMGIFDAVALAVTFLVR
jgi:hypothetical protein